MQELAGDWLRESHMMTSVSNASSDKFVIWKNTGCTYIYCKLRTFNVYIKYVPFHLLFRYLTLHLKVIYPGDIRQGFVKLRSVHLFEDL